MFGENRELITLKCSVCGKYVALRVDRDDLKRHLDDGVFVQHAFVDRDGVPYLTPYERELILSLLCEECWKLLCPQDAIAYN